MISGTIFENDRTLSAQTGRGVLHIGVAFRRAERRPQLRRRRGPDAAARRESAGDLPARAISCYPNAGLPDGFGGFKGDRDHTAAALGEFARNGWLNLVGGCCGTTPDWIHAIAEAVKGVPPRKIPDLPDWSCYSGNEALVVRPETNFIMVGERTNITGSQQLRPADQGGQFRAALVVAREQVENGANIIDVNMDADLIDGEEAMTRFLNLVAADPASARVPVMIDSSKWSVIEAGLKCVQGKGIVNSISLKEGEEKFLEQARLVKRYGAAVVVMAFDEEGQAVTADQKSRSALAPTSC